MSAPTTYAELKSAIADWGDRDDSNIDATAAECIALAEHRLQRELSSPEREATITLPTMAETIDLPQDLWAIRAAFLDGDPKTLLEPMTLADLRRTHAAAATGRPRHHAVSGEQLVLGPAPDSVYDLVLTYIRSIPALSGDNDTNWLLTDHPDLYLNGALVELFAKYRDSEGISLHEARLQAAIDSVNRSGRRRSQGAPPIRIRASQVV
ncbi:phage adaptor protein [Sphingosinicella terrae]|uniref:phage adaptor protein n=1 Tax=Sphingosinicella terrae TaxID=2172047 RepID=UPI000E0DD417|nr:hypothetical protein [Sphingosinicella terrae]